MPFVLDASSALPWCFTDEASRESAALLQRLKGGDSAIVPAHWPAEMLSAMIQGKRRNRIDDATILANIQDIQVLPIRIDRSVRLQELAMLKELSDRLQLNAYDVIYLALAMREHLPLATNDAALQRACTTQGIPSSSRRPPRNTATKTRPASRLSLNSPAGQSNQLTH